MLTDLRLSHSGNVEVVTPLALGFVAFAAADEPDKYFPNLGSTLAACADAFGWQEDLFSVLMLPAPSSLCIGAFAHFRRARTIPCDSSSL